MKIWINIDGVQSGPHSLEELQQKGIDLDNTYVWHEGLDNWVSARESGLDFSAPVEQPVVETVAPAEPQLVAEPQPVVEEETDEQEEVYIAPALEPTNQPEYAPSQQEDVPECPPTNVVWAIISLICCCWPLSVVALIYALRVRPSYEEGDYKRAQKLSETAAWWCIASIVIGIIASAIVMPLMSLGA